MAYYYGTGENKTVYRGTNKWGNVYYGNVLINSGYDPYEGYYSYLDASLGESYPGTGNTWYDILGVANGTINNATWVGTTLPYYFDFAGSSSYVDLGNNYESGSGGLLFGAFVYLDSAPTSSISLFSKWEDSTNRTFDVSLVTDSGTVYLSGSISNDGTNFASTNTNQTSTSASVAVNDWTFVFGGISDFNTNGITIGTSRNDRVPFNPVWSFNTGQGGGPVYTSSVSYKLGRGKNNDFDGRVGVMVVASGSRSEALATLESFYYQNAAKFGL